MRYRPNHKYSQEELERYKRWSRKYRTILISSCVLLCAGVGVIYFVKQHNDDIRRHERIERENKARAIRIAQAQKERRENEISDSIRRARYADSIAQLPASPPSEASVPSRYNFEDVDRMVQKVAHDNYCASAWQIDDDNWIMHYSSGEGKREKHYFRKFNVFKKTYGPVMKMKRAKIGEYYLASNPKQRYIQEGPYLVYYVNGVEKGKWHHNGHLLIDLDTPEEPYEGYDSWEDYYYDNEEDLYFYYGGK